jgi:hypothetical protein
MEMAKPQEQMPIAPNTAPRLTVCRNIKSTMLVDSDDQVQSDPLVKELAELAEFIKSQRGVLIP